MSNAQKALVMAAGIFLAIALITLAVVLFISAQDSTKAAQSNFSNIQTELSQTAFTVDLNAELTAVRCPAGDRRCGNRRGRRTVRAAARSGLIRPRRHSTECPVYGVCPAGCVRPAPAPYQLSHALDESNINYVNPSGKFRAQLVHDSSNVIRGIVFRQQ